MLFFLIPTPRSRREPARMEGNDTPVLESTTELPESFRESEPQRGSGRLEKKEFSASWRNWCLGFDASSEETATPARATAATATETPAAAAAAALKDRDVEEGM